MSTPPKSRINYMSTKRQVWIPRASGLLKIHTYKISDLSLIAPFGLHGLSLLKKRKMYVAVFSFLYESGMS